ncbi:hypothetical protein H9P43_005642 [Blastocladiella emersonii ATCC 22665]|nr:hypothetical protein H9P43_005642 [Blastocladiella emersonii ATCC 22665]
MPAGDSRDRIVVGATFSPKNLTKAATAAVSTRRAAAPSAPSWGVQLKTTL